MFELDLRWFRGELNQLHPGNDSERFPAQNLKYDLEKYFESRIA